jgi:hypothetical protein
MKAVDKMGVRGAESGWLFLVTSYPQISSNDMKGQWAGHVVVISWVYAFGNIPTALITITF